MTFQSYLHGLYLFTTVLGVGITAVDMLGILGSGGDHGQGDPALGEHGPDGGVTHEDAGQGAHIPILSVLRYVRMSVYFSLGFGPLGLIAEGTGAGVLGSLAWAVPGGLVAACLAHAFFRFQQRDVDSSVRDQELLCARGRVIVPVSNQNMGKVRVKVGQVVVERYALAEDVWDTFRTDEVVEIVRVTDDCVYICRAEGGLCLDDSW